MRYALLIFFASFMGCVSLETQQAREMRETVNRIFEENQKAKLQYRGNYPTYSLSRYTGTKNNQEESDDITRLYHMENYLKTLINEGGTEAQIMSCRRMIDELKAELSGDETKETSYVDMINTEPADDDILINGTISYVTDLIVPPYDVKITYDKKTRSVYVKFRTPVPYKYKYDYSDVWDRWRFNQWIVLQEFKKAKISVSEVTVETNHDDGSAVMKITHSAEHIDKYAKLADENLWLRTGTFYQKEIGSDKWERIDN